VWLQHAALLDASQHLGPSLLQQQRLKDLLVLLWSVESVQGGVGSGVEQQ
jgi:hypothetical protein